MKKQYNFDWLNEYFNTQATPTETQERLYKIAINYAKSCDEYGFPDMQKDVAFLQFLADNIVMTTEKQGKEGML